MSKPVLSNYRPAGRRQHFSWRAKSCDRPQRFQWPAEAFRKKSSNVKFCWKMCDVTFASTICLLWIKCICTRTMNNSFSVYQFVWFIYLFIYLFCRQTRRYGPPPNFRCGTCLDGLCVFSVPRRSYSWRVHPAQWTQYRQINLPIRQTWLSQSGPRAKFMAHLYNM